jgi:hypothetical protein
MVLAATKVWRSAGATLTTARRSSSARWRWITIKLTT